MFEKLLASFREKLPATEIDAGILASYFQPKKLRKRQFLLQEGDVCNRVAFVESGSLYSYAIDDKGVQRVFQFAFEGWWISDLYSFFTQEPSRLSIEAMEDCSLFILDRDSHYRMLAEMPAYETYTRILYQKAYIALQQRMEGTLGLTGEEKYLRLLDQFPSIFQKVPLQLIASYLGVTPETLSRIRKNLNR
jgi:CRP-like cAMP-binding protein